MRESRTSIWSLVLLVVLIAGPAAAQLQTGDLYGKVSDPQGQALPGVTITLSGVGSPQLQVADETGSFRFVGLYPGSYQMKAELQGYSTVEFADVGIRVGSKTNLEVTMAPALSEAITVTGEAPLLDERQLNRGTDLSSSQLDQIPTARDPWSLLSLAPGVMVDRVNVGGNESGQQSTFLGVGSVGRDNVFSVDGVVLTDMNAVGGSATYFDFGAFEDVQLTVASTDTSIATAGVTINQVTKRGTNEWRGQGRYLRTDGSWQSSPTDLSPGRVGGEIDTVEEYGADIGGPLMKDHLWIWGSYGVSDIRNLAPLTRQLDKTKLEDFNYKANFQLGQSNSGVLHYWTNDKLKFGRGAGADRAPAATHDQTTPSDIYKIEDTWIPSSTLYVNALASRDDGAFTLAPQGGRDADVFVDAEGVRRGSDFDFAQTARIDQARLDTHVFVSTGGLSHELKFGAGYRDQENHSGTVWPRNKVVFAAENVGLEPPQALVQFPRNRTVGQETNYKSVWAQDTLSADRLTFNLGVRWDRQTGKNLPTVGPANPEAPEAIAGAGPILPALNFAGNDAGDLDWNSIVPRLGVTYALGAERKTLLRGTFSQYAEQLGQLPLLGRVNPLGYSYAYFYFEDANHNLVLDPGERPSLQFAYTYNIDPEHPAALVTPNVNDPDLKPMLTSELTGGIEQALRADLALGLTLTWRRITRVPEQRLLIVDEGGATRVATRADWDLARDDDGNPAPIQVPLPNGRLSNVPVYVLRDGLTSTGGSLYTNGDRRIEYKGVSLTLDKRLANRWSLRGHVTWADWKWRIGPDFRRFDDPTDLINDGLGYADGNDTYTERSYGNKTDVLVGGHWSFDVNGLYQVAPDRPWGFNVGGSLDGREGYISPPYARVSGPAGRRNVQLDPDIEHFRHDNVVVLNGHLDKELSFGDFSVVLGLDGFNLTNQNVVLQVDRNSGDTSAYLPSERLSPRVFRLGATLRFR